MLSSSSISGIIGLPPWVCADPLLLVTAAPGRRERWTSFQCQSLRLSYQVFHWSFSTREQVALPCALTSLLDILLLPFNTLLVYIFVFVSF